jgi:hypothetical protein
MTKLTWIYIVAGLVMGTIALASFLEMRKMRGLLTRQSLFLFVGQFVNSTVFGIFVFSGIVLVLYLATTAVIWIPTIVRILNLPKDDHVF